MRSLTWSRNPSSPSAARVVMVATVPSDTGVPNSSASAWAVRFFDMNWPTYRYRMIAVIRGPYCTGAVTPAGGAPQVVVPHEQRRRSS